MAAAGFVRADGDDLMLSVRLTPRSAKEGIGGVWRDEKGLDWLQVSVRAVPEKGRANVALVRFVADRLGVPARDVVLEAGDTNRLKRLRIVGRAAELNRIGEEVGQ